MTSALISAAELAEIIEDPHVKIVDASYNLTDFGNRIGDAVDFNIDDICDPDRKLPHMLPSADSFAQKVGALGIGNNDTVIVYDRAGFYMAAARVWWMFRVFGHDNVRVLDGGMPEWERQELPLLPKQETPLAPQSFNAIFRPELVRSKDQILENIKTKKETVIDARAPTRFKGTAEEPRPVATGHIPGSVNLPFITLIKDTGTTLKPETDLAAFFTQAGIDVEKPVVTSCGSGVTACVLTLALHELGHPDVPVYDGSWTEWAADPSLPKVTG